MPAKPKGNNSHKSTIQKDKIQPELPVSTDVLKSRLSWFLFGVAFFLFLNTLAHGFVLDDLAVIEKNTFVQQGFSGIPKLFSTFYWQGYWDSNAGLYRPLSLVMFAVEWAISPENPFIHHFVNVLLYAVSIVLLFRLLVKILPGYTIYIPFFTTLLFAVHPIHSEVVANIKSRDEILCFLFFILTFSYILKTGLATFKSKLFAAFLFLLCLLSKEAGILFLPIIGLWFMFFRNEKIMAVTLKLLPLLIVSGMWLILHQSVISSSSFERITYSYHDNSLVNCAGASQVATGIGILGRYMLHTVLPLNMSYDYSYNQIPCETFGSPLVLATLVTVAILLFAAIRLRKSAPAISFGLLYFFITIILVVNVFTLIGTTMGDRLLFAPVLGICIAVVYGIAELSRKYAQISLKVASFVFSLLAITSAAGTFNRNKDWESNAALFTADVERAPNSARTHFNYAVTLMGALPENNDDQIPYLPAVIKEFNKAIEIDSADAGSHINLGVCYYRIKDYNNSVFHTRTAIAINNDKTAYNNLADAYYQLKNADSAIVYYQKAIDANLAEARTYNFMGVLYFNQQKYPEAIRVFNSGLKAFPENEDMMMNLGSAYGLSKQYNEALDVFHKVVKQNPNNKKAYYFLALTYQSLGDVPNTEKYLQLSR